MLPTQWLFNAKNTSEEWSFRGFAHTSNSSLAFPLAEHTTWVLGEFLYIFGGITQGMSKAVGKERRKEVGEGVRHWILLYFYFYLNFIYSRITRR